MLMRPTCPVVKRGHRHLRGSPLLALLAALAVGGGALSGCSTYGRGEPLVTQEITLSLIHI